MTLRGLVLPVGGIKEKILAAHRGGITHVILPARNKKDLLDLPVSVRDTLTFTLANEISEVLQVVFEEVDAHTHTHTHTPTHAELERRMEEEKRAGGHAHTHTHTHTHVPTPAAAGEEYHPFFSTRAAAENFLPTPEIHTHTHTHTHAEGKEEEGKDAHTQVVDLSGPILRSQL
jgi:hypothetical protein